MNKKLIYLGVAIGLITPFVVSCIIFKIIFPEFELAMFLNDILKGHKFSFVVRLSAIANLALFFLFLRLNKELISRGILISTLLIGIYLVVLYFT